MQPSWVYIISNRPGGTLYIGVTTDLVRRIHQHRTGAVPGFTTRYNLDKLVFFEEHATVATAIQREKTLKHWPRAWKLALIEQPIPSGATSGLACSDPRVSRDPATPTPRVIHGLDPWIPRRPNAEPAPHVTPQTPPPHTPA